MNPKFIVIKFSMGVFLLWKISETQGQSARTAGIRACTEYSIRWEFLYFNFPAIKKKTVLKIAQIPQIL